MLGVIQPQWIAKMYAAKAGRDHLGLGSVSSGQILPSLAPSINVLTIHPRYHSFYVFLLDEFWQRDLPRSSAAFKEFFRPKDFLFSLGVNLCDMPEHGEMGNIVGSQKTQGWAGQNRESYTYASDYIKSDLSGYGLYYRTVMAELGLVYPGGVGFPYPFDVPSEYGKEVAEAYRSAIRETRYYKEYFYGPHQDIPREVILEYIQHACLCQLKTPAAPDRPYLLQTFLSHGTVDLAQARRNTFRMFLDLAHQTQASEVDEEAFRTLLYFGQTDSGQRYLPGESVRETYVRWHLYQAREYYAFALNALWTELCNWGVKQNGVYRPLTLQTFWQYVETQGLDFGTLAAQLELPAPHLNAGSRFLDLLEWLKQVIGADEKNFDQKCGIDAPVNEYKLYSLSVERNSGSPVVMIAGMLTMLGLVKLRFASQNWPERPEWEIARMGADGRLSMDLFLRKLQKRLDGTHATIAEVARWLYVDDVILQHELVATGKLPENTFRFQREGDSLRFQDLGAEAFFNSSRFDAISTTLHDLGLCGDLHLPGHGLTADGLKLLEDGTL
ncbi:MAG: hypothetical protein WCK35_13435 [Chloroflexota bacterium]